MKLIKSQQTIEEQQHSIRWRIKAVVTRLMRQNSVLRTNAYESKTTALHRQNLSAITSISTLRNSVGLSLCHADAFRQRVSFSFGTFLLDKQKKSTLAPDTRAYYHLHINKK